VKEKGKRRKTKEEREPKGKYLDMEIFGILEI